MCNAWDCAAAAAVCPQVASMLEASCAGSMEVVRYANELISNLAAQQAVLPTAEHTTLTSAASWLMQIG